MLVGVTLKLGGLLGERRDAGASAMVAEKYSAAEKTCKASKYLINRQHKAVKAVQAAAQRIRDCGYKYSFPWGDSRLRLLPVKAESAYRTKVDAAISDFWDCVDDYVTVYPSLVYDAEQTSTGLGLLFDATEYPRKDQIKGMFKLAVEYWPIPDGKHFIADLTQEAADEARANLSKMATERANEAVNETLQRVESGVAEYIERLGNYRVEDSKVVATFRDSLTRNITELSDLVKKLNFTDDPGLDNLAEQINRLARYSCETLRDDRPLRDGMLNEAQSLINKLDGFRKTDTEVDNLIGSVADYT